MLDIVGKTFGRLRVIKQTVAPEGTNPDKRGTWWLCKCEPELGGCGNEKVVFGRNLTSGSTKSCGCLRRDRYIAMNKSKGRKDLTGEKFGCLLVLGRGDDYVEPNGKHRPAWLCKCDICNGETNITTHSLKKNKGVGCSLCFNKNKKLTGAYRKLQDLSGSRFGKLLVKRRFEKPECDGWGLGTFWFCECDCGNTTIVNGGDLKRTDGKEQRSCGCDGTESTIAKELKKYCVEIYSAIPEYPDFKNPETGHSLPYDIYVSDYSLFVEVHGPQHYFFVEYFHKTQENFEYQQYKDQIKKEYAEQHGTYIEIDLRKIKTTEEAIKYVESFINK
jgi:hypothetical protein